MTANRNEFCLPGELLRGANNVFELFKIHLFSRYYFPCDRSSLLLAEDSGKRGRFAQSLPFLARINHQRQYLIKTVLLDKKEPFPISIAHRNADA